MCNYIHPFIPLRILPLMRVTCVPVLWPQDRCADELFPWPQVLSRPTLLPELGGGDMTKLCNHRRKLAIAFTHHLHNNAKKGKSLYRSGATLPCSPRLCYDKRKLDIVVKGGSDILGEVREERDKVSLPNSNSLMKARCC